MSARTIHPFPARMAPEIALDAIPERSEEPPLTVLDPMCGSGTVLSAAVSRGHHAIGVDIDPLAVLMSRVATSSLRSADLASAADLVRKTADVNDGDAPWIDDETEKFSNFWFGAGQRRDLIALSSAISQVEDAATQDALRVALSRIIVTKSPQASLAADTSHSRPHRVIETSDYDVLSGFSRSVRSLGRLLDQRSIRGRARVMAGDSRILQSVDDRTVDLVVTSPPYLNALDYLRGHKLALIWFGYSIPELRRMRSMSIGSERAPDNSLDEDQDALVELIRRDAADPEILPVGTLRRFAIDMTTFASTTRRVVKDQGRIVVVVGNSTLRGNYIRNDLIAQTALERSGFDLVARVEREIPEGRRYMAINTHALTSTLRKRMRSEVVLTMAASR